MSLTSTLQGTSCIAPQLGNNLFIYVFGCDRYVALKGTQNLCCHFRWRGVLHVQVLHNFGVGLVTAVRRVVRHVALQATCMCKTR